MQNKVLEDVSIILPVEYLDRLSRVIRTGIAHEKTLTSEDRENLSAWWDAEEEFSREDFRRQKKFEKDIDN